MLRAIYLQDVAAADHIVTCIAICPVPGRRASMSE